MRVALEFARYLWRHGVGGLDSLSTAQDRFLLAARLASVATVPLVRYRVLPPSFTVTDEPVISVLILFAALFTFSAFQEHRTISARLVPSVEAIQLERLRRFREWGRNMHLGAVRTLNAQGAGEMLSQWKHRFEVFLHHVAPAKSAVFRSRVLDANEEPLTGPMATVPIMQGKLKQQRTARAALRVFAEIMDDLEPNDVALAGEPPEHVIIRVAT